MDTYEGLTDEEILTRAEEFVDKGDLYNAKQALSAVRENSGRKYFVESKFYKNKGWYNEERKCLKYALKAEPENEEYKKALEKLEKFQKSDEYKEIKNKIGGNQMGGKELLAEACCECSCEGCALGICEGICDGL